MTVRESSKSVLAVPVVGLSVNTIKLSVRLAINQCCNGVDNQSINQMGKLGTNNICPN